MIGGSYRHATAASSTATFAFTGSRIDSIGPKSSSYGKARVWLDGTEIAVVDQYRSAYANKQVVWSSGDITPGAHTLIVEVLGEKRTESTGTRVMIDAFDVVGSPSLSKFDDLDERIGWSRDWAKVTDERRMAAPTGPSPSQAPWSTSPSPAPPSRG